MRILVTVASRHGGTREIGQVVAQTLREAGHEVDELEPDDVPTVTAYDAVVLGSSVYVGRLAAAMRELVDRDAGQLAARPLWLFWSGPVGDPLVPPTEPDDVATVAKRTGAHTPRCFAGRLNRTKLGLAERALVAMIDADEGDFRDLDAVRTWVGTIADELTGRVPRR
jgi:menaquinone-dependent protoporphyrinogen oxidase